MYTSPWVPLVYTPLETILVAVYVYKGGPCVQCFSFQQLFILSVKRQYMVDTERGIDYYLENWAYMPGELVMTKIKEHVSEPSLEIWNDLVEAHPEIELYPNERPKTFVNMIHELINWLPCIKDDKWDTKSSPVDETELVQVMCDFFKRNISEATIETLRKAQRNWLETKWNE